MRIFPQLAAVVTIAVFTYAGCAHQRPIDAMYLNQGCDSITPPLRSTEHHAFFPDIPRSSSVGTGTLIGVIAERDSDRPLSGIVYLSQSTKTTPRRIQTNTEGHFVFLDIPPGTYEIRARLFGYRQVAHQINIRADAVDTVRMELRYFACIGY